MPCLLIKSVYFPTLAYGDGINSSTLLYHFRYNLKATNEVTNTIQYHLRIYFYHSPFPLDRFQSFCHIPIGVTSVCPYLAGFLPCMFHNILRYKHLHLSFTKTYVITFILGWTTRVNRTYFSTSAKSNHVFIVGSAPLFNNRVIKPSYKILILVDEPPHIFSQYGNLLNSY